MFCPNCKSSELIDANEAPHVDRDGAGRRNVRCAGCGALYGHEGAGLLLLAGGSRPRASGGHLARNLWWALFLAALMGWVLGAH